MGRRRPSIILVAVVALPLGIGGCATNEQTYGLGGAAVGAVACGAIGNALFHSTAGTLGSAAGCGAIGYFVGSAIGRKLDERDRQRATSATMTALDAPVRYRPHQNVVHTAARPASWTSDHGTGNRGSARVVEAEMQPQGGECRTVREVAYIKGQETTQESKYCRSSSEGEWKSAA